MDNLEQKLRKIVMTGIGAIVDTVEKSREAIKGFAQSEQANDLEKKGEDAVRDAMDFGNKAVKQVKNAFSDAEIRQQMDKEKAYLSDLARKVKSLSDDQRDVMDGLMRDMDKKDGQDSHHETDEEHQGIGKPGVTESEYDRGMEERPYQRCGSGPCETDDLVDCPTPTAPDDEANAKRSQTNHMNDHIKQNVPRDY